VSSRSGKPSEQEAGHRAACDELDTAVNAIYKQHDPLGLLPFTLAFLSGLVVCAVTARSLPWYLADLCSLGATVVTRGSLMVFRVASWSRDHPLLAEMRRQRDRARDERVTSVDLCEAIARHYLPKWESQKLLGRLAGEERPTRRSFRHERDAIRRRGTRL
jgi:hypothetical protein